MHVYAIMINLVKRVRHHISAHTIHIQIIAHLNTIFCGNYRLIIPGQTAKVTLQTLSEGLKPFASLHLPAICSAC